MNSVRSEVLAAPELRSSLERFVRGRVPASEVDDVVQATLADALSSERAPEDKEELRRWVFGIAKNKVADVHRRGLRDVPRDSAVSGDEAQAESAPLSARDLMRWAEKELPENEGAQSTLEWMLREGDGEKLEHIAAEAKLPPTRVRQRVSRLRKHYRARWAAQLAAVAALAVLALAVWAIWRGRATPGPDDIALEKLPQPGPEERAREIRRVAFEHCAQKEWQKCVEELDRAKSIDPKGDEDARVRESRAAAGRALTPAPVPTSSGQGEKKMLEEKGRAPTLTAPPAKNDKTTKAPAPSSTESSIDPPVQLEKAAPRPAPKKANSKEFDVK